MLCVQSPGTSNTSRCTDPLASPSPALGNLEEWRQATSPLRRASFHSVFGHQPLSLLRGPCSATASCCGPSQVSLPSPVFSLPLNMLAASQLLQHPLQIGAQELWLLCLHHSGCLSQSQLSLSLGHCYSDTPVQQGTWSFSRRLTVSPGLTLGGKLKSPGAPYIYLRHLFYAPKPQHSGRAESRDLKPASTFSSCFGTAHKVRLALAFLNGQK